jgi:hypothetical protein
MKTKNLLLLPSSLAVYLLIVPSITDLAYKLEATGKLNAKDLIGFVSMLATIVLQQVTRYNENDDENLHTPRGLPGSDPEEKYSEIDLDI